METRPRPLVLIRGFGGLDIEDDRRNAYQGFNDGTVYPGKRGQNYIYEGFVIKALKSSEHRYNDATDVIGYYPSAVEGPTEIAGWNPEFVKGSIVIDPRMVDDHEGWNTRGTIWVFRYYDLNPRNIDTFAEGLVQLIERIRYLAERNGEEEFDGVDVIAHSMGGLVMVQAMRLLHEAAVKKDPSVTQGAAESIHRAITLGTPHRGIAFQRMPEAFLSFVHVKAASELGAFDPTSTEFLGVPTWFPLSRLLTVVGTNYRDYNIKISSAGNRLASLLAGDGMTYNRSDGLVKQAAAQLPGAPRTFVHKCHGGTDSLVTSREAYEIAMRFFHGTHSIRLSLDEARINGDEKDFFGRSEFFFGVTVKPRFVDFSLFEQSAAAENCYGPFRTVDLSDDGPGALPTALSQPLAASDRAMGWAGDGRLIWEGWIDSNANPKAPDMVFRLDVYVAERDTLGIGFSDNVIFAGQYWLQVIKGAHPVIFIHTTEQTLKLTSGLTDADAETVIDPRISRATEDATPENAAAAGWTFPVGGPNFAATLRLEVAASDQAA
ncbi:MAG: hypothetical protein ABWX76_15165 [Leifsonia flava]